MDSLGNFLITLGATMFIISIIGIICMYAAKRIEKMTFTEQENLQQAQLLLLD